MNAKKAVSKIFIFLFIGFIIVISVAPLLWVVFSSFKTNREILSGSAGLPAVFSFKNYGDAMRLAPIPQFYLNSLIVAVSATVLNVFLLSMAAYVIARFKWRMKGFFRMMFSVGLLIPGAALLQPLYQVMTTVRLHDTLFGLILVYIAFGLPTTVYVMTSYFKTIPLELEESAYLDGSGFFRTFSTIILPLAKPAMGTAAVLEFLVAWNEFQFALTLTSSNQNRPIPIALY